MSSFAVAPFPIPNFRQVFAVFINVLLVLDQLVPELLLQVNALIAGLWQAIDGVHHEVKAIQIIHHCHVERGGNRALFLVAADMDVAVIGAAVGKAMD